MSGEVKAEDVPCYLKPLPGQDVKALSATSNNTLHLMDMPVEVRNMILSDCLVVRSPINPYPAFYDEPHVFNPKDKAKPCLALLSVSKALRAEATPIFFGKNTFRVSPRRDQSPLYKCTYTSPRIYYDISNSKHPYNLWSRGANMIRHVITSFDPAAIEPSQIRASNDAAHKKFPNDNQLTRRRQQIQTSRMTLHCHLASKQTNRLRKFRLKTLTVDIGSLYCPLGCCREHTVRTIALELLMQIKTYKLESRMPQSNYFDTELKIVGLKGKDEYAYLQRLVGLSPKVQDPECVNVSEIVF